MSGRKTDKILILLPFWKGDKNDAMGVARLLADLEPGMSGAADFAFLARRDCKHDSATVNHVSRKFNTYTATSQRQETGWPQGCNGLFFGGIDWCLHSISRGKIPAYKAIFLCAADTCPIVNDGIMYLHSEWDRLSKTGVKLAGAMIGGNARCQAGSHINGDCLLISGELDYLSFIAKQAGTVIRGGGGWDWVLAPQFEVKGWANIPGVISQWKRGPFHEDEWDGYRAGGVKWIHGVKGPSLLNVARKKLL